MIRFSFIRNNLAKVAGATCSLTHWTHRLRQAVSEVVCVKHNAQNFVLLCFERGNQRIFIIIRSNFLLDSLLRISAYQVAKVLNRLLHTALSAVRQVDLDSKVSVFEQCAKPLHLHTTCISKLLILLYLLCRTSSWIQAVSQTSIALRSS